MRYYNIQISGGASQSDPANTNGSASVGGSSSATTASNTTSYQWSSAINGQNDPYALDIEFDIQFQGNQGNNSYIKIKGIDPSMIGQATNLNNKRLQMWAGFTNGLPLANLQVPHQGLILDGKILPAFGNWIYNELSLDLYVLAGPVAGLGGPTNPTNIVHNMPAGTELSVALQNTLKAAFPSANIIMNISDRLKLNYNDYGFYQSLEQLSNYVRALSISILGRPPNYKGVTITTNGNNIRVDDGTKQGNVIALNYYDLVGQPTWIENATLQITTCLRGDLTIGSNITLPPVNTTETQPGALIRMTPSFGSQFSGGNILNFVGTWKVTGLRHIGKFRSTQADAWITIINAVENTSNATSVGTGSDDSNTMTSAAPNESGQHVFHPPSGGASGGIGSA